MKRKKTKTKYTPDLPGRMYLYFINYEDRGAPSFTKFAKSIGVTTLDLEGYRSHKKFNLAYIECQQIRIDYITDRALDRRFDSSFTKYLLTIYDEQKENEYVKDFVFSLEVKD